MPDGRDCPNCRKPAPAGAAECPACGLIFAKWDRQQAVAAPTAQPADEPAAQRPGGPPRRLAVAAALAALAAASQFRGHLPLSETMAAIRAKWLPLELFTSVLYIGEQVVLGMTGDNVFAFSMVLGTEWAALCALLLHFWRQGSRLGLCFMAFWMGTNLFTESFFVADAKAGHLTAALAEAGFSGPGGRDWSGKLSDFGLLDWCVGLGQFEFFIACWLMTYALLAAGWVAWLSFSSRS